MIETCPKKCMIVGTCGLAVLTVVVLVVESHYASDSVAHSNLTTKGKQFPTENNSTCWLHQEYSIVSECHPCTEFEIKSKSIGVCIHTHYKELLKCKNGEVVTRSCDKVAYLEELVFWKFMAWMLTIGCFSSAAVMLRMRSLNKKARRKAQTQLANGLT